MNNGPEAVPWPDKPWSEIIPGLYQGGAVCSFDGMHYDRVVVADEFDLVVSLYKERGTGPDPEVTELHYAIPDGRLQTSELDLVIELIPVIALALTEGKKVLVRCQAGYNRSGLIVGMVLIWRGMAADAAIDLIKAQRSRFALFNGHFQQYLHEFERDLKIADAMQEAAEGTRGS